MQIGRRFRADAPPAGLPAAIAVRLAEIAADTPATGCTLTYLEGAAVVTVDGGEVLRERAAHDAAEADEDADFW